MSRSCSFGRLVVRARGCLLFRMGFGDAHAIDFLGVCETRLAVQLLDTGDSFFSQYDLNTVYLIIFHHGVFVSPKFFKPGFEGTKGYYSSLACLLTEYLKPSRETQPASAERLEPTNASKLLFSL